MFFAFAGLGYIIWSAVVSALKRLDEVMVKMQGGTMSLEEISDIVGSKALIADPYYDVIFYVTICLWIFAIIDAYRIGKQREIKNQKNQ